VCNWSKTCFFFLARHILVQTLPCAKFDRNPFSSIGDEILQITGQTRPPCDALILFLAIRTQTYQGISCLYSDAGSRSLIIPTTLSDSVCNARNVTTGVWYVT
jgi:hypothetical protein